jgi:1,2-dihydroxy-3-keto-5-methylthiopentene dioxygenase
MSELRIYSKPTAARRSTHLRGMPFARELASVGVRFEHGKQPSLSAGREDEGSPRREDIERLKGEKGYQAVDVISLTPDHPDRAALRAKFLNEHTHSEDEVRFFVAGRGMFTLHIGDKVYEILFMQGDLIGVPDGTRHWFDMSEKPYFIAIRLFTNKEGWVANFTGSDIAGQFPRLAAEAIAA